MTVDGRFQEVLFRPLLDLQDRLTVHLITVNVYRQQDALDFRLGFPAVRLAPQNEAAPNEAAQNEAAQNEAAQKQAYVESLGAGVAVIGQGADDAGMMAAADLAVCVLSPEGVALETLLAADLVMPDTLHALQLFASPLRIVNTLRK